MTGAVEDNAAVMFLYCLCALVFAAVAQGGLPEAGGFRYAVNDYNGNEQSHQQNRVGNGVNGQYKVLLPDGRLQTVTYIADEGGYRAKVDYTPAAPGEATTAGKGLPQPAASRFTSVIGNGYGAGIGGFGAGAYVGAYGTGAYGAGTYGTGSYAAGAYGAGAYGGAGSYGGLGGGYGGIGGGYGGIGGGYGAVVGGYGGIGAGYGGVGGGYGGVGAGIGAGGYAGYSSPIYGALGYSPIGYSAASPTGYSYGYSTPFSQVSAYSNILGGIGY